MGTTLRIAHNVFEKVRVEKDRKERLQKCDDWQKEKIKKLKALEEIKSRIRHVEESNERKVSESSLTSFGEQDHKGNGNEAKTGARRKTSRSSMQKGSISSIPSSTDYKTQHNLTPKRTIVSKTETQTNYETSVNGRPVTYSEHSLTDEDHKYTTSRKRFNGWKFLKGNINLIDKNQKRSTSPQENSETKVLNSSLQRNHDLKDVYLHARENKTTTSTTSQKVCLEYERKQTGCGGEKQCTIC